MRNVATVAQEEVTLAGAEAWRLLFELFRAQRPRIVAIAAEFDLTLMQANVLHLLDEPLPMSTLAERLSCDASNVTGIVDRLEARGLIERRGAEGDRRVKLLAVTRRGVALRRRLEERIFEPPHEIATLSARDQQALRDILSRASLH
jgi:MarR family transcriptional regulator, organic hydroperoxide resistance regulator